ncbi:MAG TPA: PDZ domain-containing protein, partial [Chthoniobacteraceae bacterium]|nr:PDZ domain-containing protein [Chthoniobacteraceae bacterium]
MFRPAMLMLLSLWLVNPLLGAAPQHGIIGARLSPAKDGEFFAVSYVEAHSAAAMAGLKSGDTVTAIDGVATSGMTGKAGADLLKGAVGTEVTLTIRRAGSADRTIAITRQSWVDAYSKAAEEGDTYAEYNLGTAYYYGYGAEKDFSKAAEWYRKSAGAGYALAQITLGDMCQSGKGMEKDEAAATGWFAKAAAQGNAEGEERLGEQFYWGHGTAQNYGTAFAWFYSAAMQDDPWAEYYLGVLYCDGRGVARDYSQSFGWYYRSVQQNNPRAQAGMGYLYAKGLGVRKDPAEALRCYQAALAGLPDDDQVKRNVVLASLTAMLKSPVVESFNPALLPESYLKRIRPLFEICTVATIVGMVLLLFYTLRAGCVPPRLPVAVGWLLYNPASQGASIAAILLFVHYFTPTLYFEVMGLVTVLPVIVSSLGAN